MHAEELFREIRNELKKNYPEEEAKHLALLLLEDKYGIDIMAILKQSSLEGVDLQKVHQDIKELQQYTPVQHITQKVQFCGLYFKTDARALIPRPETEEIVQNIIETIKGTEKEGFYLLDVGTGSGCMAITLAKNFPQALVYALDISEDALVLAKENAAYHKVNNIEWIVGDILSNRQISAIPKLDFLMSNPPYITKSEKNLMHENVLSWEPHTALFVNDNEPLLFYKAIIALRKKLLKSNAKIFFEINERFGNELIRLLELQQFKDVLLKKDFRGKNRFIKATYSP
mgnify:CR=1 FL=1